MFDPASVRFRGPLAAYVEGFWRALQDQGYAPLSARNLLLVAAHFSRWLCDRRLGISDLSEEGVSSFLAHRRRQGYTQFLSPRGVRPLLDYLRKSGVAIEVAPAVEAPLDRLLREYGEYLARERCLKATTIRGYVDFARQFGKARFGTRLLRWDRLRPADIADFVLRESRRSVRYCTHKVTALRSLLRFVHVRGDITRDLAASVPAVASWRLAWLPKALPPEQVACLLRGGGSRTTDVHRRDRAIVRLMLRLGLRAGDIAALQLDDLDWRAGEIVVCGKGRRQTRLPLPQDVGREIAAYLRHRRPEAVTRKVFLRGRAPYGALTPGGVVEAIRAALRRAGITQGGAHVLRHTAATEMLRHGASLPEIAHVLRHRHVDTTAILLLSFAEKRLGKPPSALSLGDVDATFVSGFLDHLERDRSNEARTRNARLAAIRSFFRFAALREPAHGALIQRVLALPQKRFDRDLVTFLTRAEIDAVLAAADRATWLGRRDHVLLVVAVQTGLRVSELTGLRAQDLVLGPAAHVRCHGKGRKERCTPLARPTVALVRTWLAETQATGADLLFATRRGTMLSRDAVDRLVAKYVAAATRMCPSLGRKHVTPHVLRHSTAIGLLEAGVDRAVIALWLGHESVETTQVYLDADLAMKERALARTAPLNVGARRFRPRDSLLSFLEGL